MSPGCLSYDGMHPSPPARPQDLSEGQRAAWRMTWQGEELRKAKKAHTGITFLLDPQHCRPFGKSADGIFCH